MWRSGTTGDRPAPYNPPHCAALGSLSRTEKPTDPCLSSIPPVAWPQYGPPKTPARPSFDALARRETYATSGPRIALRFHAGWGIDEAMIDDPGLVQHLEAAAVPMGSVLTTSGQPRVAGVPCLGDSGPAGCPPAAYSNGQGLDR